MAQIVLTLRVPTNRIRSASADLLSALCVLSPYEGHQLVLDALSDVKLDSTSPYRFSWLVSSLNAYYGLDQATKTVGETGDDGIWEWRQAVVGLINALTNTPDEVEARCQLRGELERRNFKSALEVRCSVRQKPLPLTASNLGAQASESA